MILESPSEHWKDYELIDSGNFEKLERFGSYILARPEPKALWDKSLPQSKWDKLAHTSFKTGAGFGRSGKEDSGSWIMSKKMPEQWQISYRGGESSPQFNLRLGLTSFKHVGVFPEQSPNWNFIYQQVKRLGGTPKVLNLFAYTGAASLAAKAAGADTTHLDAVKQVVTWARQNQDLSNLDSIRWVVEDALKFVKREAKRGRIYDGILLDPPAYGHGPDGERWKLDECLNELLKHCSTILAPKNSFLVLNLYSNGYSAMLSDTLTRCAFGTSGERISGELLLKDSFGKVLPLSVFTRLIR